MKTCLACPCGDQIVGVDEDDLVDKAQSHLADKHPTLSYTREDILWLAY